MSKRFYLCKIYGNGKDWDSFPEVRTPTTGPFRPAIEDVIDRGTGEQAFSRKGGKWRWVVANNKSDGTPIENWALVCAEGNHAVVVGHPDIEEVAAIEDKPKQIKDFQEKTRLGRQLREKGRSSLPNTATVRDALNEFVAVHNPDVQVEVIEP